MSGLDVPVAVEPVPAVLVPVVPLLLLLACSVSLNVVSTYVRSEPRPSKTSSMARNIEPALDFKEAYMGEKFSTLD